MDFSWTTIVIIILLIIIVYFVWTMLSSSTTTSSVTQAANTKTQLTVTASNSFTFSVWIYVSSWTTTENMKPIITTSKNWSQSKYFSLSLGQTDNGLYANVGGKAMPPIPNIPLQTWALITASVNNGNSLDIYINGKLVQTTALQNTFSLDAGSVDVGGDTSTGFSGFIFATFTDSPVGPQDVWNTYSSGYGSGGSSVADFFNRYKVRFAFVKDNVELNSLDI